MFAQCESCDTALSYWVGLTDVPIARPLIREKPRTVNESQSAEDKVLHPLSYLFANTEDRVTIAGRIAVEGAERSVCPPSRPTHEAAAAEGQGWRVSAD